MTRGLVLHAPEAIPLDCRDYDCYLLLAGLVTSTPQREGDA